MVSSLNFWRGRNVFITGVTGFIGSHLAGELYRRGSNVTGLTRLPPSKQTELFFMKDTFAGSVEIHRGYMADYKLIQDILNSKRIDLVIHLAGTTEVGKAIKEPRDTFMTNLNGTTNVLEAARLQNKNPGLKVIIASSDNVHGEQNHANGEGPLTVKGLGPYDACKIGAELIAQSYLYSYGVPSAITRFSNVYGDGDLHFNRIIPYTFKAIIGSESPIIRSDGSFVRDYTYIEDVVDAYMRLGEAVIDDPNITGEAFNFGGNNPLSVIALVNLMLKISERTDLQPQILNLASTQKEIRSHYPSTEKAERVLGWKPSLTLKEGLNKTHQWYKNYLIGE